jgi:hypothetical protein
MVIPYLAWKKTNAVDCEPANLIYVLTRTDDQGCSVYTLSCSWPLLGLQYFSDEMV